MYLVHRNYGDATGDVVAQLTNLNNTWNLQTVGRQNAAAIQQVDTLNQNVRGLITKIDSARFDSRHQAAINNYSKQLDTYFMAAFCGILLLSFVSMVG